MNEKYTKLSKAFLLLLVFVTFLVGTLLFGMMLKRGTPTPALRVCTQEAKLCPDGKTSVSRTGPQCQFVQCPSVSPSPSQSVSVSSAPSNLPSGTPIPSVDTSSWKTYRNEEYGFEVKYPFTWVEHLHKDKTLDRVILSNVSTFSDPSDESLKNESAFLIDVILDVNERRLEITEWFDDYFKEGTDGLLSKSTVAFAGRQAVKIEVAGIGRHIYYYIPSENDIIHIAYPSQQPLFEDIYSQMLSSFSIK